MFLTSPGAQHGALPLSEGGLEGGLERAQAGGSAVTAQAGLVATAQAGVRGQASETVNSARQTAVQILLDLIVLQFLQHKKEILEQSVFFWCPLQSNSQIKAQSDQTANYTS